MTKFKSQQGRMLVATLQESNSELGITFAPLIREILTKYEDNPSLILIAYKALTEAAIGFPLMSEYEFIPYVEGYIHTAIRKALGLPIG